MLKHFYLILLLFIFLSGTKIALTTATFWLCSFLATQFVPLIINSVLGVTGFFYILIGINVFSFMIPLLGLPETKVIFYT